MTKDCINKTQVSGTKYYIVIKIKELCELFKYYIESPT